MTKQRGARKPLLTMQNARRLTQGFFLLLFLFLFLQTQSKGADTLGYPVKLFLDFDPLLLLTTLLASHSVPGALWLSLILLGLTVVLGRVFCGWVCPLGTLNNMAGAAGKRRAKPRQLGWFRVKYLILAFLLASSLFTMQVAGILDPLSLIVRSFSLSLYPALNYGLNAALGAAYGLNVRWVSSAADVADAFLKKWLLSFSQPYFLQGLFVGLVFLVILGLNLVEKRFWCRYLCPLGALLGIASRFALLKRSTSEACVSCEACERGCQGGASPGTEGAWKISECLYCWNCDDPCPFKAVTFGFSAKKSPAGLDLGRRRVMTAAATGIAAVALARSHPASKPTHPEPLLIRPPGALKEDDFLERCVKCGECMKVCLTGGLQPTLLEAGWEGIWSPILVPRIGYCEYRCTLCGQVCPTGAIKRLGLEEKAQVKIGLAMIDKGRCLPYAHATPCIVCEEVCPTPKKAVWFERNTVRRRDGTTLEVQQPRVDLDLCIGCGICEAKCPVVDRPAIYVTSVGESRSQENQLMLS